MVTAKRTKVNLAFHLGFLIKMKGVFRIFAAELDGERLDVVPDLAFTQHYGF